MSGKYALIIGNTEYTDPGLAQLTAPGKDAEDFARVLKDQNICAFDDVRVLLNQASSSVIEVVDEFFDQRKTDDLLVLYFSGHGLRDEFGSLYLAFKNTIRSRLRSTAIKDDYIRGAMDQSRSKRQVVILDCCNSGAFPQGTKAETGGVMGLTQAFQGYGRFVLTASDATQYAWEGDKVIGETDNSLFTHFLVKGLEGEADSDGDGKITVDELYDYTYEEISKVTAKQTPTKSSSKVEGEIVLRQFTRMEDIKPVALPEDLIGEIEDLRPLVREGAVQRLIKILNGKNIGLQRSAIDALENIAADENTTRRVSHLATQALEAYHQVEQRAEAEQKAKEEAVRLAILRAEEERLAREKTESERRAKEEAERLLRAQAERQAAESEAMRLKAEREAAELAAREAADKAAKEKTEKESVNWAAAQKAGREAELGVVLEETAQTATRQRQKVESDKVIRSQEWVSIFWITLGWAIGWVAGFGSLYGIGSAFGFSDVSFTIKWSISQAITGAIGGFATGITLKIYNGFSNSKSLFWITSGWAIGLAISSVIWFNPSIVLIETLYFSWAIGAAIGGFATAITLRAEYILLRWKSLVWVILGWSIGLLIGVVLNFDWRIYLPINWRISLPIFRIFDSRIFGAINWTLSGAIAGAIGGVVMIWQIKRDKEESQGFPRVQVEHITIEKDTDDAKATLRWSTMGSIVLIVGLAVVATGAQGISYFAGLRNPSATEPPAALPSRDNGLIVFVRHELNFGSCYTCNSEIYVMNADGSQQTRLTNNTASDDNPEWSPDGKRIAFVSDRDGNGEIYVMNANGSQQTRLTTNTWADYYGPHWSPDGQYIAFSTSSGLKGGIYVMKADGSEQTRLTIDTTNNYDPQWSPDGQYIAFNSDRDGNPEIYVMKADGSEQTRLTFSKDLSRDGAANIWPVWSPDSQYIAFNSNSGDRVIYVMKADGSEQTPLTNYGDEVEISSWSPDSRYIVFDSNRDGNRLFSFFASFDIYVVKADGSEQIRLTKNAGDDFQPKSQPIANSQN